MEMAAGSVANVKNIFSRCLMSCPNVDLWFTYLKFIRKSNESKGPDGLVEVKQAYDFTLDCIGQDIHAGPLWQEYINFLQAPKPGTPGYMALYSTDLIGGQEAATRIAVLRRAYQRAIQIPTHSLEQIWKMYEGFENTAGNKQLASRVLNEYRPRFQAARVAYRERKRKMEGVDPGALAAPPGKGGPGQEGQVRLWKAYLDHERANAQRVEATVLLPRVSLAYDQALMCLRHFPEVWYDYARWHADAGGGPQQATAVLARSVLAMPSCLLLHFAMADMEEAQGQTERAKQVYEELVKALEAQPPQPPGANGDASTPAMAPTAGAAGVAAAAGAAQGASAGAGAGEEAAGPSGGQPGGLPPDQAALVWIQYMRFCRRSESVTASRKMFIRAKKAPRCPWQVYVAAARMEWRHAKEREVARKIFEKGLEIPELLVEPHYISAYVQFLLELGDVNNARALFERVLTEDANRRSQPLWERYLSFEFETGDLQAALRLEKRAREALGEGGAGGGGAGGSSSLGAGSSMARSMAMLLLRYEFEDTWPCEASQRPYLAYVAGKGPVPPGYERRRGDLGDVFEGSRGRPDRGGPASASPGAEPVTFGGDADPTNPYNRPLPRIVEEFLDRLPPPQYLDGPLPDIDAVVEAFYRTDLTPEGIRSALVSGEPSTVGAGPAGVGPRASPARNGGSEGGMGGGGLGYTPPRGGDGGILGVKRDLDADEDEEAGRGPVRDVYRMRVKQRARIGAGGEAGG